jgi:hypothetical protein
LPEDFYPILESYAREVLRDQPLDIIEYSYLYFKHLEEVSDLLATYTNLTNSIYSNRELLTNLTTRERVQIFHPLSMEGPNDPSTKRNQSSSSSSKKTTMMSRWTSTVRSRMATAKSFMRRRIFISPGFLFLLF